MNGGLGFAMALQFKPDGKGGWVYRKDQYGPALPVTEVERNSYVRWYGWMVVLGFVLYFLSIVGLAMVADAVIGEAKSNGQGAMVAIGMAVVTLGGLYLLLRWWSHAPQRAFADRVAVAPQESRKDVFKGPMSKLTYRKIALRMAMVMAVMLVAAIQTPEALWLAIALPIAIGCGVAFWKWRVENAA